MPQNIILRCLAYAALSPLILLILTLIVIKDNHEYILMSLVTAGGGALIVASASVILMDGTFSTVLCYAGYGISCMLVGIVGLKRIPQMRATEQNNESTK